MEAKQQRVATLQVKTTQEGVKGQGLYQHRPQTVWAKIQGLNSCKLCFFYLVLMAVMCSMCRGLALSMSVPVALYVGTRRSLYRGPALSLYRAPALPVSGSGALCVGARRSLCRALTLSASGPGALCVGPRAHLCRAPALSRGRALGPALDRCRPGACLPSALCVGPRAVCVWARRSLCWFPALSVSGLGAFSLSRRSLSARALFVGRSRRSLCRGPALSVSPDALCIGPGALRWSRHAAPWSAGPQLRSACHPSSPARSFFPERTPHLTKSPSRSNQAGSVVSLHRLDTWYIIPYG